MRPVATGCPGTRRAPECFLSVTEVETFVDTATGPFRVAAAPLTFNGLSLCP